jgi:plastocyanin
VLAALSTDHKIGLAAVGGIFIVFALVSSFVLPRMRPGFPGRALPTFLFASGVLFAAMIIAVVVFGREPKEAKAGKAEGGKPAATAGPSLSQLEVKESEWKVALPKTTLEHGTYDIMLKNDGKIPHDLTVKGAGVDKKTPVIGGGKTATLQVDLKPGAYDFYCSVPGHKQLGMDTKVKVT